jgi:hypothetical protein
MIIHFTQDLHFTSLHYTSLPTFHFSLLLEVLSPTFKALHFSSLVITFLILFLKIYDVEGKVASASAGSCSILGRQKRIFSFFQGIKTNTVAHTSSYSI